MSEINGKNDFEELLEDYISPLEKGSIVKGRVVKISQQSVLVLIWDIFPVFLELILMHILKLEYLIV